MPSVAYAFLTLLVLATPALAQVAAEPASVSITADIIRANIRVSTPQKVVLTVAVLVDKDERAYELADRPSGIPKDEPGGCVVAKRTPPSPAGLCFKTPTCACEISGASAELFGEALPWGPGYTCKLRIAAPLLSERNSPPASKLERDPEWPRPLDSLARTRSH